MPNGFEIIPYNNSNSRKFQNDGSGIRIKICFKKLFDTIYKEYKKDNSNFAVDLDIFERDLQSVKKKRKKGNIYRNLFLKLDIHVDHNNNGYFFRLSDLTVDEVKLPLRVKRVFYTYLINCFIKKKLLIIIIMSSVSRWNSEEGDLGLFTRFEIFFVNNHTFFLIMRLFHFLCRFEIKTARNMP